MRCYNGQFYAHSMPHYSIGDIQGCHAEFCELLSLIGFSPASDRLWLTGDLVNRGPDSLGVVREVIALGESAVTVLGNHDLHLLTVSAGHRDTHRDDTLASILDAPDRHDLVDWLAHRPLALVCRPASGAGEVVLRHIQRVTVRRALYARSSWSIISFMA